MSNEETVIAQPQNKAQQNNETKESPKVEKVENVAPAKEEKKGNGKKVAGLTGAAVFGGVAGGAGTAAAAGMFTGQEEEVEAEVVEEETPAAAPAAKPEQGPEEKEEPQGAGNEGSAGNEGNEGNEGNDYTNMGGANPISHGPATQGGPQLQPTGNGGSDEVQVLGVYGNITEDGVYQEAALLTNGEEVAVVVDLDGDGTVDVLAIDENHNQQIDENEVYDVSNEGLQMSQYENAYMAQHQEEILQQEETVQYTASDEMDYCNDAEIDTFNV